MTMKHEITIFSIEEHKKRLRKLWHLPLKVKALIFAVSFFGLAGASLVITNRHALADFQQEVFVQPFMQTAQFVPPPFQNGWLPPGIAKKINYPYYNYGYTPYVTVNQPNQQNQIIIQQIAQLQNQLQQQQQVCDRDDIQMQNEEQQEEMAEDQANNQLQQYAQAVAQVTVQNANPNAQNYIIQINQNIQQIQIFIQQTDQRRQNVHATRSKHKNDCDASNAQITGSIQRIQSSVTTY